MEPAIMDMGKLLFTICIGYVILLLVTAAILWFVVHMYQRSNHDEMIMGNDPDKDKDKGDIDMNNNKLDKNHTPKNKLEQIKLMRKNYKQRPSISWNNKTSAAQTDGNLSVDDMFRRIVQYRLVDKNIDKFLAGPRNRSILCNNTPESYMQKF